MHSMRKRIISRNALNRISLRKVKTSISRNIHTSHGALVGVANAGHNTPFRNHRNGSKAVLLRAHRGCQLYEKKISIRYFIFSLINGGMYPNEEGLSAHLPSLHPIHSSNLHQLSVRPLRDVKHGRSERISSPTASFLPLSQAVISQRGMAFHKPKFPRGSRMLYRRRWRRPGTSVMPRYLS